MGAIDHIGIYCPSAKFTVLVNFYTKVLAPLGLTKSINSADSVGFGEFEIFKDDEASSNTQQRRLHFAFVAESRQAVDDFHAAAMTKKALSVGNPGLREDYGPTYYAAFVKDPIGNGIEAVCQKEE